MFKHNFRVFDAAPNSEGKSDAGGGATSLQKTVDDAVKTEGDKVNDKKEDKPDDKKPDDKKPEITDDLSDEDKKNALTLFKALKDPDQQGAIIEFFAKQGGYQKIETKQEAKEAKDATLEALKESLGEEFGFLADKLAPAITKIIQDKLTENTKDIREKLAKSDEDALVSVADAKQQELAKLYFNTDTIPDNILDEMSKLMDRVSPSKGMGVDEYVESIFYSVVGKQKLVPVDKTSKEKTNRNKSDVPSQLSGIKTGDVIPIGSKKMSLDEAVRSAVESIQQE